MNGRVKITDGSQSSGYVLTSDATGLATWLAVGAATTVSSTGVISIAGSENYISKFGTSGIGLYISQLFDNGTNVGIGTATP